MTDQWYGDYEFEIYFDGLESRTPVWGNPLRWEDLTWPRSLADPPILLRTSGTPTRCVGPKIMAWRRLLPQP